MITNRTPPWRLCAAAAVACTMMSQAQARCIDEDTVEIPNVNGTPVKPVDANLPRLSLQAMVREAIRRSHAIGAARLLAEAAASDVEEARSAKKPQASLSATLGAASTSGPDITTSRGAQGRVGINVGQLLYDSGRSDELTGWRKQLFEAAKLGQLNAQEQIGLQTVSLALERSRFRSQAQIYKEYGRKMGCLVEALEQIVNVDKGRASELVQARKTVKQADLSYTQTLSSLRQTEVRLSRFIGDAMPSGEGMSSLLLQVPPLADMVSEAERAAEIAGLGAQANALDSYARSVVAGQKPQLNWSFSGSRAVGAGSATSLTAGISVNVPIANPGVEYAVQSARKRAEAARLQREEALESRKFRMAEVHEQAQSAFDRAKRTADVVRDSDRLRNYTLQQWQQLGKRSLFDVMATEGEHYQLRVAYVNALHDGEQAVALLRSLGLGIAVWLE